MSDENVTRRTLRALTLRESEYHVARQSVILLLAGDIRHARRVFEQQTGGQRGGEGEEYIREDGREQRRAADAGRVPEGLPSGRGAVKNARSLIPTPPHLRASRRRAIVMTPRSHTILAETQRRQQRGSPPRSTRMHTRYTRHVSTISLINCDLLLWRFDEREASPSLVIHEGGTRAVMMSARSTNEARRFDRPFELLRECLRKGICERSQVCAPQTPRTLICGAIAGPAMMIIDYFGW